MPTGHAKSVSTPRVHAFVSPYLWRVLFYVDHARVAMSSPLQAFLAYKFDLMVLMRDFHQSMFRALLSQMLRVINELLVFLVLMLSKETVDVP
jgi:hypothetical protein